MSAGEQAPCEGVITSTWQMVDNQTAIVSNSGETDVLELGTPFWEIDVRVDCPNRTNFDVWKAFLARRWSFDLTFTMWHSLRSLPVDRTITSDTSLAISGISEVNSTISFTSFGASKTATLGDMISYRTADNGYWVGMVTETTQADVSGVVTVPVWPRPRAVHATTVSPRRLQALGEFRLSERPRLRENFKDYSVQFKARQVIR